MSNQTCLWGLFRRRQCLVPSWRGWLVLAVCLGLPLLILGRSTHAFLAMTDPLPGGILIVEGWGTDRAMEAGLAEFRRHHYDHLFVTGGPIDEGAPLCEYKSFAQRGAAILLKMGLGTNEVEAVPAPMVMQDRTYTSAVALRRWLDEHGLSPDKANLISEGPHARRSRLLYEKGLKGSVRVGVIAVPDPDYDARHWWRYSTGVRTVIGELLAYGYARFLFIEPAADAH